jgi:PST family polysaccharide transporter
VLGERALGIYSVAFKVPELGISAVSWNVSQVAFPALSRKRREDAGDLARSTLKLLRIQALFAIPMATGMIVLAGPLIVTVFGEQWRAGAGVLAAAAAMAAGQGIGFPIGDLFKAVGRQRRLVVLNVVLLVPMIIGIVSVADAGITAVAWVRAAASIIFAASVVAMAGRLLRVPASATLRAAWPGLGTGLGVLAGAGAVRLTMAGDGVDVLVAGMAAGAAGGLLALRVLAPGALGEVLGVLRGRRGARDDGEIARAGCPPPGPAARHPARRARDRGPRGPVAGPRRHRRPRRRRSP